LQRNIDGFSKAKGIADYGRILVKIVEASHKQRVLLDERQKLLEKELMKKPKLKLEVKECIKDTLGRWTIIPQITNQGDEIAQNCRLLIMVPADFELKACHFAVWDSTARIQAWSCELPGFIPYGETERSVPQLFHPSMNFSMKILPNAKLPYRLKYILYHDRGADQGELVINLSECR
jgi:hypothetical protein